VNPHPEQKWRVGFSRRSSPALASWKPLCLLYPALFLLNASGQDALFSSVSLDNSLTANNSQSPALPHFGPVQFGIGAFGGMTYDDNINGSQNSPETDAILRVGANLHLDWPATDRSGLQLGTGIGYLDYLHYSGNNGVEITPNSALTYAVSFDDVTITPFDQFSYTREVRTQAALANIVTLPLLENNVGLRAEWDPGHWTFLGSYSHADYVSDHADDYLNHSAEYIFGRAGCRFAEETQVGLEASDGFTFYQLGDQGNSQNLSVGGYVEWLVRPSLQFTLRGGPVFYEPNSAGSTAGSSNFDTYYVSLDANQQITDYLSQDLNINRSLQAGLNKGSGYIEQLGINYMLTWQLTQWTKVSLSGSYVDGRQPLESFISIFGFEIPFVQTEEYQQYGASLQASWQCTAHLSASLSYSHWLRNSNLPGRGYSDNSVSCQFNYNF